MRITYRDGEALILAEADQLIAKGATLTAVLRDGTALNFPFASQEVLEDFFRTVILPAGENRSSWSSPASTPGWGDCWTTGTRCTNDSLT